MLVAGAKVSGDVCRQDGEERRSASLSWPLQTRITTGSIGLSHGLLPKVSMPTPAAYGAASVSVPASCSSGSTANSATCSQLRATAPERECSTMPLSDGSHPSVSQSTGTTVIAGSDGEHLLHKAATHIQDHLRCRCFNRFLGDEEFPDGRVPSSSMMPGVERTVSRSRCIAHAKPSGSVSRGLYSTSTINVVFLVILVLAIKSAGV